LSNKEIPMPLYESRKDAENRITVSTECRDALVIGPEAVIAAIVRLIATRPDPARPLRLACDGWYDIDWPAITALLQQQAGAAGITITCRPITGVFQPREAIEAYKRQFTETDDPGFGVVNTDGHISDLMVPSQVEALRADLLQATGVDAVIVYGAGAAVPALADAYDLRCYFDKTRQPILWEMWDGKLVPFGWDTPKADYGWKEYYYCDYYLLDRQKEFLLPRMDYWVEGIAVDSLKLLPRAAYDGILQTLLQYPVKEVPIFQPGPWGAYRYKDICRRWWRRSTAWGTRRSSSTSAASWIAWNSSPPPAPTACSPRRA
jgi:hypothetical protein